MCKCFFFFFQAEDGIRDVAVTGVQTCALPIWGRIDLLLIDSTPIDCARSRETVKRSALADAADYGWCASHSRYFWGFRLHAIFAPDGTPRALTLAELLARCNRAGGETLVGDKGYAGREFAQAVTEL